MAVLMFGCQTWPFSSPIALQQFISKACTGKQRTHQGSPLAHLRGKICYSLVHLASLNENGPFKWSAAEACKLVSSLFRSTSVRPGCDLVRLSFSWAGNLLTVNLFHTLQSAYLHRTHSANSSLQASLFFFFSSLRMASIVIKNWTDLPVFILVACVMYAAH